MRAVRGVRGLLWMIEEKEKEKRSAFGWGGEIRTLTGEDQEVNHDVHFSKHCQCELK